MPFSVEKGCTILFPTRPKGHHLCVILTDPREPVDTVLMVPICTIKGRHDGTCILVPGDHNFIVQDSYVAYALCRTARAYKLEQLVASGEAVDKGKITDDLLERILDGARISNQTKPFAIDFLDES